MRKMRIEIAIAALTLAPIMGYAISYFFTADPARVMHRKPTAVDEGVMRVNHLPHNPRVGVAVSGSRVLSDRTGRLGA